MSEMDFEKRLYNNLALAVVKQAVNDWRSLCEMSEEEREEVKTKFNFKELTYFFKNGCSDYLKETGVPATKIYRRLALERRSSEKANKAVV